MKIALMAGIGEMFILIKIHQENRPVQMFLCRDEQSKIACAFKMTSMIFGASSSPFIPYSVRNYNATEFEEDYPELARAIK